MKILAIPFVLLLSTVAFAQNACEPAQWIPPQEACAPVEACAPACSPTPGFQYVEPAPPRVLQSALQRSIVIQREVKHCPECGRRLRRY